ncbi:MAG: ABC transporter ATP-binding protein, partial [Akkermansia sp.]
FHRVQTLPLSFLERQRKGDIISRLMSDTGNVQSLITNVSNDIIKQPITCIFAICAFFFLVFNQGADWSFIVNLIFIAIAAYPIIVFGKRIAQKSLQAMEGLGELNTIVQQNLATQREVRAYAMEDKQIDDFREASVRYSIHNIKLVKYQKGLVPIMETVTSLALAFMLVKGKLEGMTLSDFLALAAALFMCFDAMKRTGRAFNKFNQAQGSLLRLTEILDVEDSIPDAEHPKPFEGIKGDITFKEVGFSYLEGKPVLSKIDLHIPAGQIVGLVGASGAGKTTFASLIPRFYEVSEGSLLIDGIDVRDVRKSDLCDSIALVGQHAMLFAGSIRENIGLGKKGCSNDEIEQAAARAQVNSFLNTQAQGLDTVLGESGSGLSGGQAQRVAIARAFAKDAPILILDEATASLDAESEKAIQASLEALSQGRTTLIVAHRFSTIRHAQRILVFDGGLIIGDGSHEELYATCPTYKELYDRQGVE